MIFTRQFKYFCILTILGIFANFTNSINHNTISLGLSLYILFLSKNTLLSLRRVILRASLFVIISLIPAIYLALSPISILHVLATSIGLFSAIELVNVDFTDYSRRLKLYNLIQAILIYLGVCFLGGIVFNVPIESWRVLNIDTNGMGFYIFTLTICSYLLKPSLNISFLASIVFLAYKSNTYFIMIATFIVFLSLPTLLRKLSSFKLSRRIITLTFLFALLLALLINFFLELDRLFNAFNLIFFSTGSFDLIMQSDPRRYALTVQGIDLLQQMLSMFPINLTGFGYSTFNYLEALSQFSSNFYNSNIDVSLYDMDARPHNIYISLPTTIGFPLAIIFLVTALKNLFFSRNKILSASLASVLAGLAFNEFIAIPSIYLICGLAHSKLQPQNFASKYQS